MRERSYRIICYLYKTVKAAFGYNVPDNYLLSILKEKGFKNALEEIPIQEKKIENDFQNSQSQALKTPWV